MQPVGCFHLAPPRKFPPSYSIIRYLQTPKGLPFRFSPLSFSAEVVLTREHPPRPPPSTGGKWCDGSSCSWKVESASCKQLYKSTSSVFLPSFLPVNIVMRHTLLARKDFSPFYPLPTEKETKTGKRRKQRKKQHKKN